PLLDLRNPNFTVEGNRLLAELRARGPVCRVEPLGSKRSGKTVQVGATEHLLDCLEHAGIEVPFGCRAGSCGTCEVGVLAGTIIHRDSVLSAAERAEGKKMLACVSRGKGSLTLDL